MIDPRAIIDPDAKLGANVHIGAWSVVGEGCVVGDDVVISTHVVIQAGTKIGAGCTIGPNSVVGTHPLAPLRLADIGPAYDSDETDSSSPLELGAGSTICALSRVTAPVLPGSRVAGNPAQPLTTQD